MNPERTVPSRKFRPWLTTLAGLLILAVITPLSQFLTIMTVNASIETSTPVAWAVGLLISLVLAGLVIRSLARRPEIGRANLALLYTMLALAVPLMNIGLIRQYFLSSHAVLREYMYEGTSTYRTAYEALNDRWFPVVPTMEGVAWNRTERALRMLEDARVQERQASARRLYAGMEGLLAEEGAEGVEQSLADLRAAAEDLSLDDVNGVLSRVDAPVLERLGLFELLRAHADRMAARSESARELLAGSLSAEDEWALSLLPSNLARLGYSAQERLLEQAGRLADEKRVRIEERVRELETVEASLRQAVMALGGNDRNQLLAELRSAEGERLSGLERAAFNEERNRFVFRLSRDERRAILGQDGVEGPNQNLKAFITGRWETPQQKAQMETMGLASRIRVVVDSIPWGVYARPLLSWVGLFICIFLFLMCLAEVLRRKWVSRENLPFPLVEVADYVIRHDYALETAGELSAPDRRARAFNSLFLIGFAVGFLMLLFQGLHHYGLVSHSGVMKFDFSNNIFTPAGGSLKNIPTTVFVLSPIVVGVVFLLSLEVGFSIWFAYVLYAAAVWILRGIYPNVVDGNWTGFATGKLYPFPMEQMLGAVICFALYHLWKVRGLAPGAAAGPVECYLPARLTRWGLILLPLVIFLMFRDLGVGYLPLFLIFFLSVLAISVAMARVRAETGLPGQHSVYEFTKLPIILGMTGSMGAKGFTSFMNVVFLPTTLLFRTLPQQLENMELARRFRIPFRTVAVSGLVAVLGTLGVGLISFLIFSFALGGKFYGNEVLPPQMTGGGELATGIATYPLWVGHFLGEPGLDQFNALNHYRLGAFAVGFVVVGAILLIRQRYMRFPFHPVGYLVLLGSIFYPWADPYTRVPGERVFDSSAIWGSALVAWMIKRMVVKFGGMNVYKQAKPLFVGLIVGSVAAVFLWNMIDLGASLYATGDVVPGDFLRRFIENTPFTPAFY